ncbi:MAG: TraR/DksA C4-type zinc finger protein [Deltaproteobacteria bacterium]|nr:TraR/DksA C4-type zinc finger protein [Deltaproteobacteria bacterium]
MMKNQWEFYRKRLLDLRRELLDEFKRENLQAADLKDEGVPDVEDLSQADRVGEYLHLLGDRARQELVLIDEALDCLGSGSFGLCQQCGKEIDAERLAIRPHARFCVACKERVEQEEQLKSGEEKGKL